MIRVPLFPAVSLIRKKAAGLESAATVRTKVFVWGLNDKDQLGGLKGSKVLPAPDVTLSPVPCPHITEEELCSRLCPGNSQASLEALIMVLPSMCCFLN